MNPDLNHTFARERAAELRRAAEGARLAGDLPRAGTLGFRTPQDSPILRAVGFTLRGHDLAKLDRFLSQAARAARRDNRAFEGVSIEVSAGGTVSVHAVGMRPIEL